MSPASPRAALCQSITIHPCMDLMGKDWLRSLGQPSYIGPIWVRPLSLIPAIHRSQNRTSKISATCLKSERPKTTVCRPSAAISNNVGFGVNSAGFSLPRGCRRYAGKRTSWRPFGFLPVARRAGRTEFDYRTRRRAGCERHLGLEPASINENGQKRRLRVRSHACCWVTSGVTIDFVEGLKPADFLRFSQSVGGSRSSATPVLAC